MKKIMFVIISIGLIFIRLAYAQEIKPLDLRISSIVDKNIRAELLSPFVEINAGGKGYFEVLFEIGEGYYQSLQEDYFGIVINDESEFRNGNTIYPEVDEKDETGVFKYRESVLLRKEVLVDKDVTPGMYEVEFVLFWQLCEESGVCFAPEEGIGKVTVNVLAGIGEERDWSNLLKFLLLAFLGGIILNLTPCVLPVLSMRAFALVRQSESSRRAILTDSVLYSLGVITSFAVLATIVSILKLSGEMVGWAFQFQNPVFVVFLLSVMYVFALSLFGIFTVSLPGMTSATEISSKSGHIGSFLMGCFAVLIATPCTAPLLGAALGFAFSQTPAVIFGIFLMVGLGFGFPFLMLGCFPKTIKILPKPGRWMVVFKELLGFLLLGFTLNLLATLNAQVGGVFIVKNLLPFILCLSMAVWMYGRFVTPTHSKKVQWVMMVIAVIIIATGTKVFMKDIASQTYDHNIETSDSFWARFSEEAVREAKKEGLPIFIDFTAEYCTQCKVNARLVLNTTDIRQAFTDKGVVMLKGDYTRGDEVITQWLRRYNRAGVPLYLLFLPDEDEPIIFPEILTKAILIEALEKIKQ